MIAVHGAKVCPMMPESLTSGRYPISPDESPPDAQLFLSQDAVSSFRQSRRAERGEVEAVSDPHMTVILDETIDDVCTKSSGI